MICSRLSWWDIAPYSPAYCHCAWFAIDWRDETLPYIQWADMMRHHHTSNGLTWWDIATYSPAHIHCATFVIGWHDQTLLHIHMYIAFMQPLLQADMISRCHTFNCYLCIICYRLTWRDIAIHSHGLYHCAWSVINWHDETLAHIQRANVMKHRHTFTCILL